MTPPLHFFYRRGVGDDINFGGSDAEHLLGIEKRIFHRSGGAG